MFDFVSVLCATTVSLLHLVLILLNVLDKFRCSVTKKYFLIILNIPRTFLLVAFSDHKYSIVTLKSFRRQIYSGYENIVPVSYAERSITAFTCTDRKIVVAWHAVKKKMSETCLNVVQIKSRTIVKAVMKLCQFCFNCCNLLPHGCNYDIMYGPTVSVYLTFDPKDIQFF